MQSGQRVFAKPNAGKQFRKPNGAFINPKGEEVILDSFWKRRQNDGDVTLTELGNKARPTTSEKK
jgi:hypothetical protein